MSGAGCRSFSCELRSLALLRVGLALILLLYVSSEMLRLELYTDSGPFPRSLTLRASDTAGVAMCPHLLQGRKGYQLALFGLHLVGALALLVGYRTRLAAVLCWLLTLSLQSRLPFAEQPGQQLLVALLFWGMFLPWGEHFAREAGDHRGEVRNAATVALTLQLCLVGWLGSLSSQGLAWQGCLLLGPFLLLLPLAPARLAAVLLLAVATLAATAPWLWKACMLVALLGLLPARVWGDQPGSPDLPPLSPALSALATAALLLVLAGNLLPGNGPQALYAFSGLQQDWRRLDSPLARADYAVVARLENGRTVDLARPAPNLGKMGQAEPRERLLSLMARRFQRRNPRQPLIWVEVLALTDGSQISVGRWVEGLNPPVPKK